jgi:hypothetical protein
MEEVMAHRRRMADDAPARIPQEMLELEASRIHRAVFRTAIGTVVRERFVAAAASHNRRIDAAAGVEYYAAIKAVSDLEALEVACRYAGRMPLLSKRMLLMVYLAEASPEYQTLIVNHSTKRLLGWCAVMAGAVSTACKLVKGRILLARHSDA